MEQMLLRSLRNDDIAIDVYSDLLPFRRSQYNVHRLLKRYRSVFEFKRHSRIFELSVMSDKLCLVDILGVHFNLPVAEVGV